MEEIWKPVVGYEGLYEVSNLGKVRSVDREIVRKGKGKVIFKGKLMKQRLNKQGYWRICLHDKNHYPKYLFVHRLVAFAFVYNPKPEEYTLINHKDQNPKNNVWHNLEWCDEKYNSKYEDRNERLDKHFEKRIKQIKNGVVVKIWKSGSCIQDETGWNRRNIKKCCNKDYGYKTSHGFQWEWA